MSGLLRFFWERRGEILALTGEHLLLVVAATTLAVAIGVPLGIALTRRRVSPGRSSVSPTRCRRSRASRSSDS